MAERKAVNKYYPPEWTPSKGSINKFRGTHALRERARKLHLGILIIRFEMPYNIWCEGCNNHIGMGVRYNAEKTKVGMYYSTPIYKFRMKCHLCDNHFEIKTDPKNLDYEIISGARRQERRWDAEDNEQVVPEDKEVSKRLHTDAMFQLEHGVQDKSVMKQTAPVIAEIEAIQERMRDDYDLNKLLRKKFREKKKEIQEQEAKDKAFLIKSSLDIPLLPESEQDKNMAILLKAEPSETADEHLENKRLAIEKSSFFAKPSKQTKKLTEKIIDLVKEKVQSTLKPLTAAKLGIKSKSSAKVEDKNSTASSPTSNSLVCGDYGSSDEDISS